MIFVILGYFLPFHQPDYLENQNFQKLKKKTTTTGDIIFHMCTINENHMMYGFWGINFHFSFCAIFCLFDIMITAINTPKTIFFSSRNINIKKTVYYTWLAYMK